MRLLSPNEPPPVQHHLSPRSKVVLSVSAWGSVIAAVAGASVYAGIHFERLSNKLDRADKKLAAVLTKQDLRAVKVEVSQAFLAQLQSGSAWADCPKFETKGEKRSHCKFEGLVMPEFPYPKDNDNDESGR